MSEDIAAYLELSETELLVDIGKILFCDDLDAMPSPVSVIVEKVERWLGARRDRLKDAICGNTEIKRRVGDDPSMDFITLVAGALESLSIGTAVSPIAVLLCRRGILNFCADSWNHSC